MTGSVLRVHLEEYPDDEAIVLIATAARKAGKDVRTLLQDFGEFIAPTLLDLYWAVIEPDWKAPRCHRAQ